MGELNLTVEQFGEYTIKEFNALVDGYMRRRDALEDLFIIYSALPTYRGTCKKAPSYKQLTSHRRRNKPVAKIDPETEAYWLNILKGGDNNAKKLGTEG